MIALITTFDPLRMNLLRPFIEHYQLYGVRDFYISLHIDTSIPAELHKSYVLRAAKILGDFGIPLHRAFSCPYDSIMLRDYHDQVQKSISTHTPWIVWADIDEFHEFPDSLIRTVKELDKSNTDYLSGTFIDRLARNGFPPIDQTQSIWKQFPIGSNLTESVLNGWTTKVMLCRSEIPLHRGNHKIRDGFTAKEMPTKLPVHHFKWDSTVVSRLQLRLTDDWKRRCSWWTQSKRAVDWLTGDLGSHTAEVRYFDFEDDRREDNGGPHSKNPHYGQCH